MQLQVSTKQLLPTLIDDFAAKQPEKVWTLAPRSNESYDDGFQVITYSKAANAINGAAKWIVDTLGSSSVFSTLAYIGPPDIRYYIFIIASVKAGYKLLLPSPRNDTAAQKNLLDLLECKYVISPFTDSAIIKNILSTCDVKLLIPPTFDNLLSEDHEFFPYSKSWEHAKDEPLMVMHTSGSTGLPKPIILPHAYATSFVEETRVIPSNGYINQTQRLHGRRLFCPLPPFHIVAIAFNLISAVYNGTIPILPLVGLPPTGQDLAKALEHTDINAALTAPTTLEDIGKNHSLLSSVAAKLDTLAYTGGDLPRQLGDTIASKVYLFPIYGSTEKAHGPQIALPDRAWSDWKYIQWDESWGASFRKHDTDIFELVMQKIPSSLPHKQACFTVFPNAVEYPSKDLFTRHPENDNMWEYCERADNILVFLNGEKVNPTGVEGTISSHPAVRSALLVGTDKPHSVLLIELHQAEDLNTEQEAKMLEHIWPTIETANSQCPSYARVEKSSVLFASPNKPFARAGKGTVIRKATLGLYDAEISDLYNEMDKQLQGETTLSPDQKESIISDNGRLLHYIESCICDVLGTEAFDKSAKFFENGLDSVLGLQLVRLLRTINNSVSLSMIYNNPTVVELSHAIAPTNGYQDSRAANESATELLNRYKSELESIPLLRTRSPNSSHADKKVVLLTGSTGVIGSHLLHYLLDDTEVSHVYCLNRSEKAMTAYKSSQLFPSHTTDISKKMSFLTGAASQNKELGLQEQNLTMLLNTVTHVLHCAWPVDFNLPLNNFQEHLSGIIHLIRFAARAGYAPSVTFLSSISSVARYTKSLVPEAVFHDVETAHDTGYGQSKWIAENLLSYASTKPGVSSKILRLGQIAGPTTETGVWKSSEWFPSLILSSRYLGAIPTSLPTSLDPVSGDSEVNWMPVDSLARVIGETLFLDPVKNDSNLEAAAVEVFHIVNPCSITWSQLVPDIIEELESTHRNDEPSNLMPPGAIERVSFTAWLDKLRASAPTDLTKEQIYTLATQNPAIKLIDFYVRLIDDGVLPNLCQTITLSRCLTMRDVQPVNQSLMRKWVRDWL